MGVDRWRAVRQGRRAADRFDLAGASNLDELAERVAVLTGRRVVIDVTDQLDPLGASGRLDRYGSRNPGTAELDVIRVPQEVDATHQELIGLHEFGHIMLDHALAPADGIDLGTLPLMSQYFGREQIERAYEMTGSAMRSCHEHDNPDETAAEAFALRMLVRLRRARVPHAREGADRERAQLAQQVDNIFGGE